MRRWLWIGSLSVVVLGCVVIVWETTNRPIGDPVGPPDQDDPRPFVRNKDEGDAEASEAIEPLIVERWLPPAETSELPRDDVPAPRVVLQPGMEQPPRPDEAPGKVLRMPYADE